MANWRIEAGKGMAPFNAAVIVKAIFNAILGYGTETIPLSHNIVDSELMKRLEIIQRRSLRAIIDSPFCSLNEILENELHFIKLKHYLWMKVLVYRGSLL